jgi:selT/selW/selH-like putative selenoprotein
VDAIGRVYGKTVQTETKMGSGGIFDVVIDGEKVFSKWDEGRFPENREILAHIARRLPQT